MTCCNKSPITIYQGFSTKWNDESLLTVTFNSEILLDGFGAEFTIGEIVKTYTNIEEGFNINLSAQETGTLPLGAITGTLVIIDTENNKRPFSTELPFMVKDWADGDIKLDGFDVSINAKIQENKLTIRIESANPGSATEEMIKRYIAEHNQSEDAHPYIQGLIEAEQERAKTEELKKVDKVFEQNRVYGTDGNGNQTTYPVDGFGKVDDVRIGGVSVVQNKIAVLGTMAKETASDYRKASAQDTIDIGLSGRIGTLESYTPSTASSNNKFAVESEITNLQNTKQNNISDLATIRSNAQAGKLASDTIATYGNIVTHNVSEFATSEQGALADTSLQVGDNITDLTNNAGYITNTQVNSAISTHNTSESAHSYIQGLITSEKSRAEGVEGNLSNLTTSVKNNLVSAINEVDSHADTNASNISDIRALIPNDASISNQLADKGFVNSSIATNTANFIGTFNSVAELEAYSGTLTNNDYAFVIGTDSAGNTVYDRYKYTDSTTPASWVFEYELNNSSFTSDQWASINSLATASKITQITTNQNAIGTLSSLTTTAKTNLVSAINELDSGKLDKNSAITGATKCKITYDSKGLVTGGDDLSVSDIPSLTLSKISDITATASELNVLDGITASTTELNYTDGVTSNIQTQLNGKVPSTRTINGKALSSNVTLNAGDVGALPSSTIIPIVNDATLTIQKNGNNVATFTSNQSTDVTANILVPTDTNDLSNGAGYITASALNGYATESWVGQQGYITGITSTMVTTALGYTPYNSSNPAGYTSNVGTVTSVNNTQPDANGNVTISTGNTYTAGTGISITNNEISITSPALTNTATGVGSLTILGNTNTYAYSVNVGTGSSAKEFGTAIGYASESSNHGVSLGEYAKAIKNFSIQIGHGTNIEANSFYIGTSDTNNWKMLGSDGKIPDDRINTTIARTSQIPTMASDIGAQPTLVSGTNIKTVNNQSLLGSGNIEIQSAPDVDGKSISLNSSDELQTIGVIDQNNTTIALKQWSGTKAQYDAIATKDANTVYNIIDDSPSTLNFYTKTETDSLLSNYATTTDLSEKIQLVSTLPATQINGILYVIPE